MEKKSNTTPLFDMSISSNDDKNNLLGVVVLNYNSFHEAAKLCHDILESAEDLVRVVLIDNHSTCPENGAWRDFNDHGKVKIIRNEINSGYAAGNNIGIDAFLNMGIGKILILNPDVVIADIRFAIKSIISEFKRGGFLCMGLTVEGVIPYYTKPSLLSLVFPLVTRQLMDRVIHKRIHARECGENRIEIGRFHGCAFALHADEFRRLKLFDDNTFLYGEENIVGIISRRMGRGMYQIKNVTVRHKPQSDVSFKTILRSAKYSQSSLAYIFHSYYKVSPGLSTLLSIFAVLQQIFSTYFGSVLRAKTGLRHFDSKI